jgi:nodulation protein E
MPRVAVTGLGVISASGAGLPAFWRDVSEGESRIGPLTLVDAERVRCRVGAEVRGYDPEAHFAPKKIQLMDRFAQFAVVAAREAIDDACIEWTPALRARAAVVTGTCLGGKTTEEAFFADFFRSQAVHPLTMPLVMANAGTSHITMTFGLGGPSFTIATACASATHAIGLAFGLVRSGAAPIAIAGGSDAPFSLGHLKAWEALRVMSSDTCRPFSRDRRGLVLGEGAAMLVFEPLEAARARGAKIWAEVVGFGASADADHLTRPCADGAGRAMQAALDDAGIAPEAVGYINAHGTGTVPNDATEVAAVRAVFGAHADRLAISSTKAIHGHALGAAGALEAVATVMALYHEILPPTANFTQPDPQCALDVVPNQARPAACEFALSNSFAFGGLNAVLAFRKAPG